MTKLSIMIVSALALAAFGCKKKGGDCAAAINHSMELSKEAMSKMPGNDDKLMKQMAEIGIQHCNDDKWPAEAITCMTDAKAMADAQACYGKLSADQRDKMQRAAMAAMTPPAAVSGSAATSTGSAMAGSAAAGSDAAPK